MARLLLHRFLSPTIFVLLFSFILILNQKKCASYPLARLKESPQNLFQFYSNLNRPSRRKRVQADYKSDDLVTVNQFVSVLKKSDGDWSKNGIQRLVRLNSVCSGGYVTLRNFLIRAEVPYVEAFKDPYTLIEMQIYNKFAALKSKQINKYVCLEPSSGNFVLRDVKDLNKNCVFVYEIKSVNLYSFAIGSNGSVYLTFDKFGDLVNARWSSLLIQESPSLLLSNRSNNNVGKNKMIRRSGSGVGTRGGSSPSDLLHASSNKHTQQLSASAAPTSCHLLYVHTKLSDAIMLNSVNTPLKIASTIARTRSDARKIHSRSRDNYNSYYHNHQKPNENNHHNRHHQQPQQQQHQVGGEKKSHRKLKLRRNRPFRKNKTAQDQTN